MEVANEKIGRCIHKCIYIKKGRNNHNYHSLCFWNWSDDHDLYYNYVFPLAILSIFAFKESILAIHGYLTVVLTQTFILKWSGSLNYLSWIGHK